jgi:hypothetical protein
MNTFKCPRCGSQDFNEREQHHYIDWKIEWRKQKNTYTRQLRCLKCDFEFVPST